MNYTFDPTPDFVFFNKNSEKIHNIENDNKYDSLYLLQKSINKKPHLVQCNFSILTELNSPEKNIVTVERQIEKGVFFRVRNY